MSRASYPGIKAEVLRRIRDGEWKPGAAIPAETDLATEFGCARATINRALQALADSGFLERRRKAGTRVSRFPVRKATLEIPLTRLEIEGQGLTYAHRVLKCRQIAAPPGITQRMNPDGTARLLHLFCLHLADRLPYAFEDRWINLDAAPGILDADLTTISANEWLVQNVPISDGDIAFMAEPAGRDTAAAFGIAEGTALFVVERHTRISRLPVTLVRLSYAPGYRMVTSI